MTSNEMRVADLFCGCGGLSLGFDYVEALELVYALDNWKVACASYKANFPYVDVDCRSALDVKPSEIPSVDVIIGGPPCQEFSVAKEKRRSFDCSFMGWFCDVVEYQKPKFWIMENVPGIHNFIPSNYYKKIFRMSDYGVPQIRKRLFVGKYNEPHKHPVEILFPSVMATEYKGSSGQRKNSRLCDAFKRRTLIPEAKLVQTFPLDFILCGTLQDQYVQIGNAVPPLMAYRFAEALVNPHQMLLNVSNKK